MDTDHYNGKGNAVLFQNILLQGNRVHLNEKENYYSDCGLNFSDRRQGTA